MISGRSVLTLVSARQRLICDSQWAEVARLAASGHRSGGRDGAGRAEEEVPLPFCFLGFVILSALRQ